MMKRVAFLSLLTLTLCALSAVALADTTEIVRAHRTGTRPMDHPGVVRSQGGVALQEVEIAVRR